MPLIGSVEAVGLTVPEFNRSLESRLGRGYLHDPKVSVEVSAYRPFFITGEVKNGGQYPYQIGLGVQEAVAIAGGYTYRGNQRIVFIRRASQDDVVRYTLGGRIPVYPGDSVRVPERFF